MNFKKRIQAFFSSGKRGMSHSKHEIHPDEIFLDSRNLPDFDVHQFEGRLEHPISKNAFRGLSIALLVVCMLIAGKLAILQVKEGEAYELKSQNNTFENTLIFAERGVITDRTGMPIAWNELSQGADFAMRRYATTSGLAHVVGYVKYPSKDKSGVYYNKEYVGKDGVEAYDNDALVGINGVKVIETDATGKTYSESVISPPKDGNQLKLALDAGVSDKLYNTIEEVAKDRGFTGGAGVIMDIHTGEVLSLVSYPEYDQNVLSDGTDEDTIEAEFANPANPFLNRALSGLYIPGSIIKPYIAIGVLEENVIDPLKKILSEGQITIPNPYDASKSAVFHDWKAHGWIDMRNAIAESSDDYFYTVGGGNGDQKGLGILNIGKYVRMFGFGATTGIDLSGEVAGNIPSPDWKQKTFNERWYLGDTYNSSIGQYGFQTTPLQAARSVAVFANDGYLVTPTVLKTDTGKQRGERLQFTEEHMQIVRDGMRLSAETGTGSGLNIPGLEVAAKTGTAELGVYKQFVNSWVMGYFPYDNPKYSFAVLMERGPRSNAVGATYVMRQTLDWMMVNTPEYTDSLDSR